MSDGGKGSTPRPFSVDQDTFASNWDKIFGKKNQEEELKGNQDEVPPRSNDSTSR